MGKLKILLILILFQSICSFCYAKSLDIENLDLAEIAARTPQKLINAGFKEMGDLNLEDLFAKLTDPSSVVFHVLDNTEMNTDTKGEGPGQGQTRYGGHCFDKTEGPQTAIGKSLNITGGLVLVDPRNAERLAETEDQLEPLLLHEGLCALYGPQSDDHYQLSSILVLLSKDWNFLKQTDIKLNRESKKPSIYLKSFYRLSSSSDKNLLHISSGGVTGGGGGGDPSSSFVKPLLLGIFSVVNESCYEPGNPVCRYLRIHHAEIWKALIDLHIETDNSDNTNCLTAKPVEGMPFQSIVDFKKPDGSQIKILHIGACQLEALLRTYSPSSVAINMTKLFWILCFYNSDFPKPVGFTTQNLPVFLL